MYFNPWKLSDQLGKCVPSSAARPDFNLIHARRAAMALAALSGDEQRIVFTQLCNVLDPRPAVALSSANNELRTATQALRQQLKADHEAATALCRKLGLRSCKALREATRVS
jgi:hypothetical protein